MPHKSAALRSGIKQSLRVGGSVPDKNLGINIGDVDHPRKGSILQVSGICLPSAGRA